MKWEYKTIKLSTTGFIGGKLDETKLDDHMNQLGEQGWELVSAFSTMGNSSTRDVVAVFKRQKH